MNLPCVMQVGLAGLVDQLGDLEHRAVHGQVLELHVDPEAEEQAEDADADSDREERVRSSPGSCTLPRSGSTRSASLAAAGAVTIAAMAKSARLRTSRRLERLKFIVSSKSFGFNQSWSDSIGCLRLANRRKSKAEIPPRAPTGRTGDGIGS